MRAAPRFVPTLTEVVPAPPWRPMVGADEGAEEKVQPSPPGPVVPPPHGHVSDAASAQAPRALPEPPLASPGPSQEWTPPDAPDVTLLATATATATAAAAAAVATAPVPVPVPAPAPAPVAAPVLSDPTDVPTPRLAPMAPPAPSAAPAPPIPAGADPADLAAWVEAEVGESLRRRLHDLIAMALVEQIDTVAARLRGDIEPLIRQAVLDALANEAAAREPD